MKEIGLRSLIRECITNILLNESLEEEKWNFSNKDAKRRLKAAHKDLYDDLFGADGENQDLKDDIDQSIAMMTYHGKGAAPKQTSLQKHLQSVFSFGNGKVSSDTLIVNMRSAMMCPSVAYCPIGQKPCYAHAHENQYSNTRYMDARNEVLWRAAESTNKIDSMFNLITLYITLAFECGHPVHYIRISEAGDFPSQKVYDAFNEYAGQLERNEINPDIITNPIYTTAYSANPNIKYIDIKDGGHIKIIGSRLDIKGAEHFFFGIPGSLFLRLPNTSIKRGEDGKPMNAVVRPCSDITDPELLKYLDDCGYGDSPVFNGNAYYYKCICATLDEKDTSEVELYNKLKSDEDYNMDDILFGGANKCKNCQLCYERMPAIDQQGNPVDKYIVFCKIHGSGKEDVKTSDLTRLQLGTDGEGNKNVRGKDDHYTDTKNAMHGPNREKIYQGIQKRQNAFNDLKKRTMDTNTDNVNTEDNNKLNECKGKKIVLSENQMKRLLQLMEGNASLKKKYIRHIYKVALPIIEGLHKDETWQPITDLSNAMNNLEFINTFDIWPENGGYRQNSDGTQWKEYKVNIETTDGLTIEGVVNCHAAGSVEKPFDRYDMTFTMW